MADEREHSKGSTVSRPAQRPGLRPQLLEAIPGRSAGKGPADRYLRQREYPQPPPPSRSTTTKTINKVSISHHLPPRSFPDVLDSVSERVLFVSSSPSTLKSGRNVA
jgi:hypothetical protein